MLFVDGENLTMRYQETLAEGRKPRNFVAHLQDIYVWSPRMTNIMYAGLPNVARVYYYTTVVGDRSKVDEIMQDLAALKFSSPSDTGMHTAQLVPFVFNKPKKSQKTRNVDIQIVIDMMRFSFSSAVDRIYLASGDGDYLPLISEVMRRGTQLELLAFKSGLNPKLTSAVDCLHLLDDFFFEDSC
jgi:uncharacterized LabA/DUF88 family protein